MQIGLGLELELGLWFVLGGEQLRENLITIGRFRSRRDPHYEKL